MEDIENDGKKKVNDQNKLKTINNFESNENQHYLMDILFNIYGEFKQVDIDNSYIAIANFGGPIAACRRTDLPYQITSVNDLLSQHVCFFSNDGNLINQIKFETKQKIVGFEFTYEELLLIVLQNGEFYLLDPYIKSRKQIRSFDLGEKIKQQGVCEAKVVDDGFFFYSFIKTKQKNYVTFSYVQNAQDTICKEFDAKIDIKINEITPEQLTNNKIFRSWIVIKPHKSQFEKFEIQISHPTCGIIQLLEDKQQTVILFAKDDQINTKKKNYMLEVQQIKISADENQIAYLHKLDNSQNLAISFAQQNQIKETQEIQFFNDKYLSEYSQQNKQIQFMASSEIDIQGVSWCKDSIIVALKQTLFIIEKNSTQTYFEIQNKSGMQLKQEIDGCRILTRKKQYIIRKVPQSYYNLFESLQVNYAKVFYEAYESFQSREPYDIEQIRNDQMKLMLALDDLFESACFEWGNQQQATILKAISFAKTYLNQESIRNNNYHDQLMDLCKILRIQFSMKEEYIKRALTYDQVKVLLEEEPQKKLIKILLRYNLHYKAIQITKSELFHPKLRAQIYIHWACCKVEKSDLETNSLYEIIKSKCIDVPYVSFTDIAQRAIEFGNSEVALKLIDCEPSVAKRVPLLLWMASEETDQDKVYDYFDRATRQVVKSKDSNLIHLSVMKILKSSLDKKLKFALIQENSILENHLIEYIKIFDKTGMQDYLSIIRDSSKSGMFALMQGNLLNFNLFKATQINDISERKKLLEIASKLFKADSINILFSQILDQEVQVLQECYKQQLQSGTKQQITRYTDLIKEQLSKDKQNEANKLKHAAGMSEKSYHMIQIKMYIEQKKFTELKTLVTNINHKKITIPYDFIAHLLISQNYIDQSVEYIQKISDLEKQIKYMIRIQREKEATQKAIQEKNDKAIEVLKRLLGQQSQEVNNMIEGYERVNKR